MLDVALAAFEAILFCSMGLWAYWITRLWPLLRGDCQEIDQVLDADLMWDRKLLLAARVALTRSDSLTI
jgi:hypothetical protein